MNITFLKFLLIFGTILVARLAFAVDSTSVWLPTITPVLKGYVLDSGGPILDALNGRVSNVTPKRCMPGTTPVVRCWIPSLPGYGSAANALKNFTIVTCNNPSNSYDLDYATNVKWTVNADTSLNIMWVFYCMPP